MEKLIIAIEAAALGIVVFTILYIFSYAHPMFHETLIGKVPPWAAIAIFVFGCLLCVVEEAIKRKESRRNRFFSF